MQDMSGNLYLTYRVLSSDTARVGRFETAHGKAAVQSGKYVGRDAVGSIRRAKKSPSCFPANREHCSERLLGCPNSLIRTQTTEERKS